MNEDQGGNPLSAGDVIYLPVKITSIGNNGGITGTTGYLDVTVSGFSCPDTHKGQPTTWPALP
jgi:hypothetical protein